MPGGTTRGDAPIAREIRPTRKESIGLSSLGKAVHV